MKVENMSMIRDGRQKSSKWNSQRWRIQCLRWKTNSRLITEEAKISKFTDISGNYSKQKCRGGKKYEHKWAMKQLQDFEIKAVYFVLL